MNILLISPLIYPAYTGGLEIFNYHFARALDSLGREIHLISRQSSKKDGNIKCHRLLTKNPKIDYLQICFSILALRSINVIHVPYTSNSNLIYPLNQICKYRRIPYVVYIHGGGMHPWQDPEASLRFFRNAGTVMAVSKRLKKGYEERLNRCIEFIPPVIPFRMPESRRHMLRKRLGFESTDLLFLIVGSLKAIKGSDFLVETILKIGKAYLEKSNIRFMFLGEGPMKYALDRKVKEAGFQKYVIFKGLVPHEQVAYHFKSADAYLIPSKFEGTPLSLLEALFHGLPSIGSNTSGINDILEDEKTGLLFKPFNSYDLIEKVKMLVHNCAIRNKIGKAGRKLYEDEYTFDRIIKRHLHVLSNTANERVL